MYMIKQVKESAVSYSLTKNSVITKCDHSYKTANSSEYFQSSVDSRQTGQWIPRYQATSLYLQRMLDKYFRQVEQEYVDFTYLPFYRGSGVNKRIAGFQLFMPDFSQGTIILPLGSPSSRTPIEHKIAHHFRTSTLSRKHHVLILKPGRICELIEKVDKFVNLKLSSSLLKNIKRNRAENLFHPIPGKKEETHKTYSINQTRAL